MTTAELNRWGAEMEGYTVTTNFKGVQVLDAYNGKSLPKPLMQVPDYCASLDAAWRVAEKLLGEMLLAEFIGDDEDPEAPQYICTLVYGDDYTGVAPTPAHALMLALYKAQEAR